MLALNEDLRREGAVEAVGDVVLELDAGQRSPVHPLGVQDDVLGAVGLGDVELDQDVAVVLVSLLAGPPAQAGHEDWLAHHTVGVPHLARLVLRVVLQGRNE